MATADIAELSVERPSWKDEALDRPASDNHSLARLLGPVAGAILITVDLLIVVGAFLLAHWARFVSPGVENSALGLEQYARIGVVVSLVNAVLLALDGWYDPDRVRGRFVRLRTLVSS